MSNESTGIGWTICEYSSLEDFQEAGLCIRMGNTEYTEEGQCVISTLKIRERRVLRVQASCSYAV